MDLSFLAEYQVPIIVGICLCIGYVIKHSLCFIPNKYIPLLMAVLGLIVNIGINKNITAEIVLQGLFSGLISTGLHEAFRNIINKGGNIK